LSAGTQSGLITFLFKRAGGGEAGGLIGFLNWWLEFWGRLTHFA